MPKKASQSKEWNFKVAPDQLLMPDGKTPSGVFANIRVDTKKVVGVVSEKGYGLIQNEDFVNTIREALAKLGLTDYREDILVTNEGRDLYATYSFDNRVKNLHVVGDTVGLVLRFATSFGGKKAAVGELMAKILRCLNGMTLERGQFKLQKAHRPNISLDFIEQVTAKAVNDFDRAIQVFNELGGVRISDEQGVNILKHIKISEAVREKIQAIWIQPSFKESKDRNLYTLYDAATEHLRDLSDSRFEMSTRLNRIILRQLVKGLDPENLKVMVKPPLIVPAPAVILSEALAPLLPPPPGA